MNVLKRPDKLLRIGVVITVMMLAVTAVAVAIALVRTSTPDFFSRYRSLDRRYVNLEHSAHEGIGCRVCHETNALANGVQLTGDFYLSLVERRERPAYYQFRSPTNDTCLRCHREDWTDRPSDIPHPAHARVVEEKRECVSCHKWTAHLEAYTEKHEKMPLSGLCMTYGCHAGTKSDDQCYDCHHVIAATSDKWKKAHPKLVRAKGQNYCLESCHEVAQCQSCHTAGKRASFAVMPVRVEPAIEKLHAGPQWIDTHGAQARKGQDRCLVCHYSQGECAECHRDRPKSHGEETAWIGRHKKHAISRKDPACLTCHKKSWCDDCHGQFKEME